MEAPKLLLDALALALAAVAQVELAVADIGRSATTTVVDGVVAAVKSAVPD